MSASEHFSSAQWVDLVRGQLDEATVAEVDRHLRAGCGPCTAAFETWQAPVRFGVEERRAAPPSETVRVAKALLAQAGAVRDRSARNPLAALASATFAALVFDTGLTAQAGARAAAAFSRQLLFDADHLVVDLHVDAGAADGSLVIMGQVVDKRGPERSLDGIFLSIVDDRREVSAVTPNEFGEFRHTLRDTRAQFLVVDAHKDVVAIPLHVLYDPPGRPALSPQQAKVKQ